MRCDIDDITWFLAVVEERSFTRAAARLGVSQSTLSHAVKRLETTLGIALLARTTRSVAPTAAGMHLLRAVGPRLAEIEAEIAALSALRDTPAGVVRITLSDHAMHELVWPKLAPVLARYPDIRLELSVDNGLRNIVEDGFDAGIRLGESLQKDMVAVRIGPDWRLVAVAALRYLEGRTAPEHPRDLAGHVCINHRLPSAGGLYAWEFEKDGEAFRVRVDGQLTFDTTYAMRDAAIAGYGIAYVPEDIVQHALATGSLVLLLDAWSPRFPGYFLYYPSRRQSLPAFRVVVDALKLGPSDRASERRPAHSAVAPLARTSGTQ